MKAFTGLGDSGAFTGLQDSLSRVGATILSIVGSGFGALAQVCVVRPFILVMNWIFVACHQATPSVSEQKPHENLAKDA